MNRRSFLSLAAAASIPPMAVVAVSAKPDPKDAAQYHLEKLIEALSEGQPDKHYFGKINHELGSAYVWNHIA